MPLSTHPISCTIAGKSRLPRVQLSTREAYSVRTTARAYSAATGGRIGQPKPLMLKTLE
jgi:hypothetical protein